MYIDRLEKHSIQRKKKICIERQTNRQTSCTQRDNAWRREREGEKKKKTKPVALKHE